MTEQEIITGVLQREGWDKYTDHPADKGGPTKWGITLKAWSDYLGKPCTAADVQAITEAGARQFYRVKYILEPKFDLVGDAHLRELLIDAGVNHGPRHPAKWAQWAAEVPQDGVLGPVSLKAINACAPLELFLWVCAFRVRLYGRLTSQDQALKAARAAGFRLQAEFTAGWCNRVAEFLESSAREIEAQHKG
jgi:lysozyme family protein